MRSILSPEGRELLARLSEARALIALDFDGTLAPIVADRDAACLRPETRRLLRAVALLHPCAVVSGRARADVRARLSDVPLLAVVGNHGAEPGRGPVDRAARDRVLGWKRTLRSELGLVPGVEVEDKVLSLAVHYRRAPSRAAARHLLARAAPLLQGARVFHGHAVVNVAPEEAPDKGRAVEELVRRAGPRPVLYVGDDRTDEDAFRSPAVAAAVRVGRTTRTAAPWYLPRQALVDDLLRELVDARARQEGMAHRRDGFLRAVGG